MRDGNGGEYDAGCVEGNLLRWGTGKMLRSRIGFIDFHPLHPNPSRVGVEWVFVRIAAASVHGLKQDLQTRLVMDQCNRGISKVIE